MSNISSAQSAAGQLQMHQGMKGRGTLENTAGMNMENGMLANGTGGGRQSKGSDSVANANAASAMMGESAAGSGSSTGPAGRSLSGLNAAFASITLDPSMVGSGGAAGVGGNISREGVPNNDAFPNGWPPSVERIWSGSLHFTGHKRGMVVPCVAVRINIPVKPLVLDASGWPLKLQCDSSRLKKCENVFHFMNKPSSQWYVRFASVNDQGMEIEEPKLVLLAKVMVQRKIAFEIECNQQRGAQGTLYLWGMYMETHGHSVLGVFRPGHGMRAPKADAAPANLDSIQDRE